MAEEPSDVIEDQPSDIEVNNAVVESSIMPTAAASIAPSAAPSVAPVMQYNVELIDKIKAFYAGKADKKTRNLYDYDEHGNLVYTDKKGVSQTVVLQRYRLATSEERAQDEMKYTAFLQSKINEFQEIRMALYKEKRKINRGDVEIDETKSAFETNNRILFELNYEVEKKEKQLVYARFGEGYYIDKIDANEDSIPKEKRITMKSLYFEDAPENKNVYDDIVIVETQVQPLQKMFRPDNSQIRLDEAKTNARIFKKKKKAVDTLLSQVAPTVDTAPKVDTVPKVDTAPTLGNSVVAAASKASSVIKGFSNQVASIVTSAVAPAATEPSATEPSVAAQPKKSRAKLVRP